MKTQDWKNKNRMKINFGLAGRAIVTCAVLWGLAGCGSEPADVPLTKEGRIKAIEDDPSIKPEQKEIYKKQIEDSERLKAMMEKRTPSP